MQLIVGEDRYMWIMKRHLSIDFFKTRIDSAVLCYGALGDRTYFVDFLILILESKTFKNKKTKMITI